MTHLLVNASMYDTVCFIPLNFNMVLNNGLNIFNILTVNAHNCRRISQFYKTNY